MVIVDVVEIDREPVHCFGDTLVPIFHFISVMPACGEVSASASSLQTE